MNSDRKCPFWVGSDKRCKLEKFTITKCTREDALKCSFAKYHAWKAGMSIETLIEWCAENEEKL